MATDDNNILQIKSSLDIFLYKFCFLGTVLNLILYFFPSLVLSIIFYSVFILYFFFELYKVYNKIIFLFFAEIMVINFLFLPLMAWLIACYLNEIWIGRSVVEAFEIKYYSNINSFFLANSYLCLFAAGILFCNKIIPKVIFLNTSVKFNFLNFKSKQFNVAFIILLIIAFELFYYFTGILGSNRKSFFIGRTDDAVTWYTVLFNIITSLHLVLNVIFLENFKKKYNILAIIFIAVSLFMNLFFYGFVERRSIILFFIIFAILYVLLSKEKIKFLNIFIFCAVFFMSAYQFSNYVNAMRNPYVFYVEAQDSLRTIVDKSALEYMKDDKARAYASKLMKQNIATRIIFNTALSSIFYYNSTEKNRYTYGNLFFSDLIFSIPHMIYPNKKNYPHTSTIISKKTSSPLFLKDIDPSHTIYLFSYIDFGFFGLLIYPLIINLIFYFFYIVINLKVVNKSSALFILTLLIPLITLRGLETNLTTYFVTMRDLMLFLPFITLLLLNLIETKS